MKKSVRIVLVVLLVVGLVAAALGLNAWMQFRDYQKKVAAIEISGVDLGSVPDGKYYGEYDATWVAAKVEVVVKDGKLLEVFLLEHEHDRGAAAEVIPVRMVEQQQVDVDVVAGATSSSLVIIKAVENALTGRAAS